MCRGTTTSYCGDLGRRSSASAVRSNALTNSHNFVSPADCYWRLASAFCIQFATTSRTANGRLKWSSCGNSWVSIVAPNALTDFAYACCHGTGITVPPWNESTHINSGQRGLTRPAEPSLIAPFQASKFSGDDFKIAPFNRNDRAIMSFR